MPAAVDTFLTYQTPLHDPYSDAAAVTTSDANDLTNISRALYVGVAGDVTVTMAGGEANILFKAVPAGTVLRIRVSRVWATGTTATNITALW
jgi:hypothetical protein